MMIDLTSTPHSAFYDSEVVFDTYNADIKSNSRPLNLPFSNRVIAKPKQMTALHQEWTWALNGLM